MPDWKRLRDQGKGAVTFLANLVILTIGGGIILLYAEDILFDPRMEVDRAFGGITIQQETDRDTVRLIHTTRDATSDCLIERSTMAIHQDDLVRASQYQKLIAATRIRNAGRVDLEDILLSMIPHLPGEETIRVSPTVLWNIREVSYPGGFELYQVHIPRIPPNQSAFVTLEVEASSPDPSVGTAITFPVITASEIDPEDVELFTAGLGDLLDAASGYSTGVAVFPSGQLNLQLRSDVEIPQWRLEQFFRSQQSRSEATCQELMPRRPEPELRVPLPEILQREGWLPRN